MTMLYLIVAAGLVLIFFVAAEMMIRRRGFTPWQPRPARITFEPDGRFFQSDAEVGWRHLPGTFRVHLSDSFAFTCTHNRDGLRITNPPIARETGPTDRKQIWIFGGSNTHGWSLSDRETYPWVLQELLPEYQVLNFGQDGYGTLQSLLQFERALGERPPPSVVILAYADFHNIRNTFIRSWRKQLVPTNKLGPVRVPYARLDEKDELVIRRMPLTYRPFPLMKYSALMHRAECSYNWREGRSADSGRVTRTLLKRFDDLCASNGIRLLIAGMVPNKMTRDMLEFCREEGIEAIEIGVDTKRPEYTNLPHDPHPSAAANRIYAERLASRINPAIVGGQSSVTSEQG